MASDDSLHDGSPTSDADDCLGRIIEDCLQRWAQGESVDEQAVIEAHPDLAEELQPELAKLRLVFEAAELTVPDEAVASGQRPAGPSTFSLGGIPVRCPHCHHTFQLLSDAELSGITCEACGSSFSIVDDALATDDAPPLARVGHFKLISRLGAGAFGTVWNARDLELDRTVAVKIPRTERCDAGEQERFLREARAAAQLRHPNIVTIHEVGREGSTPYIVCDLVRGVTLAQWLEAHRPGFREAATLCVKIAAALQHAHDAGVVHRDLKPSNIMMDADGEPHVMDFGVAKWEAGGVTVALEGEPLGTAAYMSPEQAEGKAHDADARSDVYSLGVILFELLTGELPFRGSRQAILHQAIHDEPPSPRKLNTAVPRDLETICLKCLEKRPELRIGSAAEVREEFTRYLEDTPIRSRPIGMVQRTLRAVRRRPAVAATIALITVIATAGPVVAALLSEQLHKSTLNEAEFRTLSRKEAYKDQVFELLGEAQRLPVLDQQWDRQRELAAQALGDFVGHKSVAIDLADVADGDPQNQIICLAFSEDGRRLAVGLGYGRLAVIELQGNVEVKEITQITAHPRLENSHMRAVRFLETTKGQRSPDLLAVAMDGTVVTCSSISNRQPKIVGLLDMQGIRTARFSEDGKRLVAQNDEYAAIWETTRWKRLNTFAIPEQHHRPGYRLESVALSPSGRRLVAGYSHQDRDCSFFLWDVSSGQTIEWVEGRGGTHENGVAFARDVDLLTLACERLTNYRTQTPLEPHSFRGGDETTSVAFHPYAGYQASYSVGGTLSLWNIAANREVASLDIQNSEGRDTLVFSGDGERMALSTGKRVHIWKLTVPERLVLRGHDSASGIPSVAFSPDGSTLISGGKDRAVRFWNAQTGMAESRHLSLGNPVQCVSFSTDGKLLAVATWGDPEKNLTIWSTDDWVPLKTIEHELGSKICGLAFGEHPKSPGSLRLAACGHGLSIWDISIDEQGQRIELSERHLHSVDPIQRTTNKTLREGRFVQFSPSGRYVVWAEEDLVRFADCSNESLPSRGFAQLVQEGWQSLAFAGDDDRSLILIGSDGRPEIWDITADPPEKNTITDVGAGLKSAHLALSSDGRFLAACADPRSVGIWDLVQGKRLFVLRPEPSPIWSLTWSTDRRLAVGNAAGGLSIWDLEAIAAELREMNLAPWE